MGRGGLQSVFRDFKVMFGGGAALLVLSTLPLFLLPSTVRFVVFWFMLLPAALLFLVLALCSKDPKKRSCALALGVLFLSVLILWMICFRIAADGAFPRSLVWSLFGKLHLK